MGILGAIKERLGRRLLARSLSGGIDLRKLGFLPDSVTMPFQPNRPGSTARNDADPGC